MDNILQMNLTISSLLPLPLINIRILRYSIDIPRWLLDPFGYEINSLSPDQRAEFIVIRHYEEMSEYFE